MFSSFERGGTLYIFATHNIFDNSAKPFVKELNTENWEKNIDSIKEAALYMKTEKRGADMYCIGSTRGVTAFPRFEYQKDMYDSLPRPYDSSKPGNEMWKIMQKDWFRSIAHEVHQLTYSYLLKYCHNDLSTMKVFQIFQRSMLILPDCIKVCGTAFSHINMTTVEDGEAMNIHTDEDDIFTAVLHLGDVQEGGATQFYDGFTQHNPGKMVHQEPFRHGKVQIGYFDKILHGVSPWKGKRYGLNFIMKKSVYDHFDKYGDIFYSKLVERQYKTNGLICFLPTGMNLLHK